MEDGKRRIYVEVGGTFAVPDAYESVRVTFGEERFVPEDNTEYEREELFKTLASQMLKKGHKLRKKMESME